jgi:hypothetical protein
MYCLSGYPCTARPDIALFNTSLFGPHDFEPNGLEPGEDCLVVKIYSQKAIAPRLANQQGSFNHLADFESPVAQELSF